MPDTITSEPEAAAEPVVAPRTEPLEPEWLPARLDRAKRTAEKSLLDALGVTSTDEAKAAIEEARKIRESQMTEADKARAEAEALRVELAALKELDKARAFESSKRDILAKHKLDASLAEILAGSDTESFTASVEKYVAANPPRSHGAPHDGIPAQPMPLTKEQFTQMSPEERKALMKSPEGMAALRALYPE